MEDRLDEFKITENHKDVDFNFVLKHIQNGNIKLILNWDCTEVKDISLDNKVEMLNELFIDDENITKLTSYDGIFYISN